MTATLAKTEELPEEILSALVLQGDLKGLNEVQLVEYYRQYCTRLGLDPATKPFEILKLNGKEILYATRACAAQLNKRDGVSHTILSREIVNGCYVVTARAYTATRQTESIGAVPFEDVKGEVACNAMMKAETKAKRRSTLDLCGLGLLDEEEAEALRRMPPSDPEEALRLRDRPAIEQMIAQRLEDAENATGERKKELLGLAAELRCKLADLDVPEADSTPKTEAPKQAVPKEQPKETGQPDWRNVECHIGTAGGPVLGKKVGEILKPDHSEKHVTSIMKWATEKVGGLKAPTDKDRALWSAIQEAKKVWDAAQSKTTEKAPARQEPEKAPTGQKADPTDWRQHVVESKLAKLNGRTLGEMTPEELAEIRDMLDKVDWAKATPKQKTLRAKIALATFAATPAEQKTPEHTASLIAALHRSNIFHDLFILETKKAGWIGDDVKTIEDVTPDEAEPLLADWRSVEAQCDLPPM